MFSSFVYKLFSCCSTEKENGNIPIIQSKSNINIILDKEKDHIPFVKENFLKRIKSRNSSNNFNNASAEKSLSIVSFSNLKVKEGKESLNQNFDTEVLSTVELKLIGEIFWNKELYVDRIGLKIGNRIKKNGITIFGLGETEDSNGNNVIDFILNIPGGKIPYQNNNTKNNPLFSIEYDKNEDYFVLNIINKELKIYHYIDYEFLIQNGSYLEFVVGKIFFYIKAPKNENDNYFNIEVEGVNYNFNKIEDCPITIGRSNCKINIKNNSISKNHAVINYIEEKNCLFIKDLESTNGTYFILGEKCTSFKILKDMDFKILDYKFSIKTIE